MKLIQHYSSSTGNLYEVQAATGERLLLECGVPWKKLQAALNYDLGGIVGCLVTHEHMDHCKAVREVMAAGIDVWASIMTWKAISPKQSHRIRHFGDSFIAPQPVHVGPFFVRPFRAHHDAQEPSLFAIHVDKEGLLFAPDVSYITQRFGDSFDIIALECSYDNEILMRRVAEKDIDESLAKRLLLSHMSKSTCMKYLKECCDLSRCRELHLLHMSHDNLNNKEAVRKEFEDELMVKTIIAHRKR